MQPHGPGPPFLCMLQSRRMDDLSGLFDELMAFVHVVEAGGFNAASARFGTPASRLSRGVAALERQLGLPLLVRTSRRFAVTEAGWRICARGIAIRAGLQDVVADAAESLGEPTGHLRVACPMALAYALVGRLAIEFMTRHPRVKVTLESTDGRNRPFSAPVDLAIQPALEPLKDSSLVARNLVDTRYVLVAAPGLAHGIPAAPGPADFPAFPAVGWTFFPQPGRWSVHHADHGARELAVDVRFTTDNLLLVREAALAGVGVAQLPAALCRPDVAAGRLQVVATGWSPPPVSLYVLYPSRRALTLAGRQFVELLAEGCAPLGQALP
jgi:DNA-binding transcriptional LysR family regulator